MNADEDHLGAPGATDSALGDHGLFERVPAWLRVEQDRPTWTERFDWWLRGVVREPLASYSSLIEDPDPEVTKTGVCCSGGGIRSAAFNLGALQELQDAKRLQNAKYLAAVSGGSYIAAAFAMIAKTWAPGADESDDSDPALVTDGALPFYRGSPEEQFLRNHSSYMAPAGIGKVRLLQRLALGLLVNLLLLTAVVSVAAWLLSLYYRGVHPELFRDFVKPDRHGWALWGAGTIAAIGVLCGLVSLALAAQWDRGRQRLEAVSLWLLVLAAVVLVVEVGLPELIAAYRDDVVKSPSTATGGGVAAGLSGGFGGLLAAVLAALRSKVSVAEVRADVARLRKLSLRARALFIQLAAWVLGPALLVSAFVGALLIIADDSLGWWVGFFVLVPLGCFWLVADVTVWSLHPFYKRRLCTAFGLKRISRGDGDEYGKAVERDFRKLVSLSESGVKPGAGQPLKAWPTLIICAAANVSDSGATAPGRGVTSFTFSPAALGGPLVGGIPTEAYEERIPKSRRRDFTLAAAVAMSGAAVSPSMGKETRPALRLLLGLANVRLGVWVPNPRRMKHWARRRESPATASQARSGDQAEGVRYDLSTEGLDETRINNRPRKYLIPRPGPWYLLKEMLGHNSVNDKYLYVTDGGHYENLGLVELLRRGCTEIFCFDPIPAERRERSSIHARW